MLPQRLAIERTGEGRFTPWSRRYSPSPPCSATATTGPQDLISFTGNLLQLRQFFGKKCTEHSEKNCQRYNKPKARRIGHGVVGQMVTALVLLLLTQSPTLSLRSTPTRSPPTSTSTPWLTITLAPCSTLTLARPITTVTVAREDGKHTQVYKVVLAIERILYRQKERHHWA